MTKDGLVKKYCEKLAREQLDKLNNKLLNQITYVDDRIDEKREFNKGLNEIIKEGKKRITALTKAIKAKNLEPLFEAYNEYEIDELMK